MPCSTLDGPMVDRNMTLSLLSSRNDNSIIMFTLSFNVSYGPPSRIRCSYGNNIEVINTRDPQPNVVREVIRSHYVSSSQPDMTRVKLTLTAPREERTYTCTVYVKGRHIDINYDFDLKGSGTSTVSITGKCVQCVTAVLDCTAHY